ncbi:hypothetical protein [Mucilaginibacter antarcticus]|uniref:hypothetical protein n=1 Tax=Mucilaginibacter antarcticus TaxID=1855725 RepID=UPI00363B3C2C
MRVADSYQLQRKTPFLIYCEVLPHGGGGNAGESLINLLNKAFCADNTKSPKVVFGISKLNNLDITEVDSA